MKKIVTFGEIMLRLATKEHRRFSQADSFEVVYGGGESNVAVSLAQLADDNDSNQRILFVSKVPDNPLGEAAISYLNRFKVNTDHILKGGDRLGIYFLESGVGPRPSKVIYDRKNSSISTCKGDEFDWELIFDNASWFHWTGITPALSENCIHTLKKALQVAKRNHVKVSVDLNYRKKLWSREQAYHVMSDLMEYVDVLICNEEDAFDVFALKAKETDIHKGKVQFENYKYVAQELVKKFNFECVAITLRQSFSASKNGWQAMCYDGSEFYKSKKYEIVPIVDRVGGGDAFAAAFIHSLISNERDLKEALEFAVAASALKHTILGDFNLVNKDEVSLLAQGDGSGRVQR